MPDELIETPEPVLEPEAPIEEPVAATEPEAPVVPTPEQMKAWAADNGFVHASQIPQPTPPPVPVAAAQEKSVREMVQEERQRITESGQYADEAYFTDFATGLLEYRQNAGQERMRADIRMEVTVPILHQQLTAKGVTISPQDTRQAYELAGQIQGIKPEQQQEIARLLAMGYAADQGKMSAPTAPAVAPVRKAPAGEPVTAPSSVGRSLTGEEELVAQSLFRTYGDYYASKGMNYQAAVADMRKKGEL